MNPARSRFALALALLAAAPAAGQEIRGTAVDSAGRPLGGVPVALHRMGGMTGSTVAAATTDEQGRFAFDIQVRDSAVYFVAMRHADRMYVGPPVRGGVETIGDYVLRAEPAAEAGAVASALSGGAPPGAGMAAPRAAQRGDAGTGAGAAWLVAALAVAAAATFIVAAPRYRERRRRELLVELAGLENRLADGSVAGDRDAAERRRALLRERLAPPG